MKRMVYIIFSVMILVVFGAFAVGCSGQHNNTDNEFVGMSLSQNHMDFTYCYSFYLRTEDDKVLFDAQVRFYEEPYEIILESCEVDSSYMEELKKIEEKYSIVEYVENYKEKKSPLQVMDETVNTTTIYFNGNADKSADSSAAYKDELYKFFEELTLEYQELSVNS